MGQDGVRKMRPNNENVKTFILKNYIDSQIEPHFALLLKGEWGCGKTFFLDTVLEEKYGEKYRGKKVIWLSLYGLSNISQLNQKFYEACHPILTHKVTKFALQIAKSAAKVSGGLDLTNDNVNDISFDFSLPEFQDDENNIKTKKLIVVDDIERCSIPPEEIFGYFSEFILDKNLKAIFIGNTNRINSNIEKEQEKNSNAKFNEIKEKIIGFEFSIEPEIEEAVKYFAQELKLDALETIMVSNCLDIVYSFRFENLRIIRQSFYFLKQILSIFTNEEIENNQAYFTSIIRYFFCLFFQKATGELKSEELRDAIEVFHGESRTLSQWKKENNSEKYNKYHFTLIPLQTIFEEIIFEGKINENKIRDDFTKWTTPPEEQPAYIRMQQQLFELDDKAFKVLYKQAKTEFKTKQLKHYSALLSYLNMELTLKFNGLITKEIEDIKKSILSYIKHNKTILIPDNSLEMFRFQGFAKKEFEDAFKDVAKYITEENVKHANELIKKDFSEIIEGLPETFELLCSSIKTFNTRNYKYYNYPILSEVSIAKFYKQIKSLPYEKQIKLFHCFNERYGKYYSNGDLRVEYYPDIEAVHKIAQKYKEDLRSTIMSPSNVQRKYLFEQYEELYKWMCEHKKEGK